MTILDHARQIKKPLRPQREGDKREWESIEVKEEVARFQRSQPFRFRVPRDEFPPRACVRDGKIVGEAEFYE